MFSPFEYKSVEVIERDCSNCRFSDFGPVPGLGSCNKHSHPCATELSDLRFITKGTCCSGHKFALKKEFQYTKRTKSVNTMVGSSLKWDL